MVSNLIVAVCAIIPLFFLMLIGVAVKKMKLLTELELAHVNRMVFKIFFFFMMFYNIYTTDIAETFRPHLMLFGALGVLASALIGGIIFYLPGILLGVLKNPMILGAICGTIFLVLGIPLPKVILKPVSQLAAATTPMALIILGASFKAGSYHEHLPQLVGCVLGRLIIVPTIMLSLAIFVGFRGVELVTLMAIFATPCAVAGYAMAQQMGSDADLAGNCVVYTTVLSCFTIFGWVFVLKTLGLF